MITVGLPELEGHIRVPAKAAMAAGVAAGEHVLRGVADAGAAAGDTRAVRHHRSRRDRLRNVVVRRLPDSVQCVAYLCLF